MLTLLKPCQGKFPPQDQECSPQTIVLTRLTTVLWKAHMIQLIQNMTLERTPVKRQLWMTRNFACSIFRDCPIDVRITMCALLSRQHWVISLLYHVRSAPPTSLRGLPKHSSRRRECEARPVCSDSAQVEIRHQAKPFPKEYSFSADFSFRGHSPSIISL